MSFVICNLCVLYSGPENPTSHTFHYLRTVWFVWNVSTRKVFLSIFLPSLLINIKKFIFLMLKLKRTNSWLNTKKPTWSYYGKKPSFIFQFRVSSNFFIECVSSSSYHLRSGWLHGFMSVTQSPVVSVPTICLA